jgi:phosphate transport system substrate-binding protein
LNKRRLVLAFSLAAILAMLAAGCNEGGRNGGDGGEGLTGRIVGDGSSTVFPVTEAVAEEFRTQNPGVDVTVGTSGTGGGFEKFCNDETDIQNASRPIEDDEKQACSSKGVQYTELTVALDGLAVVVNRENDFAKCLTTEELKKVWEPGSRINNWKDVKAGFPDRPLKLFGPGTDSGTFDYFTDVINGEEGASRTDYTPSEDDNVLVQGVEGDEGAMAYFGYAYYKENRDKLNLVGVDSGGGCIMPSDKTVQDGTYKPLSRPLFVYAKTASLGRPEVRAFVDFYLDNVNDLLGDVGYTPLSESDLQAEKQEFEQSAGGGASPQATDSPASPAQTASPEATP